MSSWRHPLTVKYMHIRLVDPVGEIYPCGGVTLAYTTTQTDIVVAWTKCRDDELFCFAKGRAEALKKLQAVDGDVEVLTLQHPISATLADWIATTVWPGARPEDMGYGGDEANSIWGFPIDIYQDSRNRWLSDFQPAMGFVNFEPANSSTLFDPAFAADNDEQDMVEQRFDDHQRGFGQFG